MTKTKRSTTTTVAALTTATHYAGVCEDCGIEVLLPAAQADGWLTKHVGRKHLATLLPREAK
jgi:hypothetical protein